MNPADIAYKAAGIMSERGHCKRALSDEEGRVCLVGAVYVAMYGTAEANIRYEDEPDFMKIMNTAWSVAERDPVSYNNDPQVSGEDVILLLKETGKRLEAEC